MYTKSKAQQTNNIHNNEKTLQIKLPNAKNPKIQSFSHLRNLAKKLDFWIAGFLDFWILRSLAFPVLLFDTNAASENGPKSDQQKRQVSHWFYSVLKGSACRRGGDHIYIYTYIFFLHTYTQIDIYIIYIYIYICIYMYTQHQETDLSSEVRCPGSGEALRPADRHPPHLPRWPGAGRGSWAIGASEPRTQLKVKCALGSELCVSVYIYIHTLYSCIYCCLFRLRVHFLGVLFIRGLQFWPEQGFA